MRQQFSVGHIDWTGTMLNMILSLIHAGHQQCCWLGLCEVNYNTLRNHAQNILTHPILQACKHATKKSFLLTRQKSFLLTLQKSFLLTLQTDQWLELSTENQYKAYNLFLSEEGWALINMASGYQKCLANSNHFWHYIFCLWNKEWLTARILLHYISGWRVFYYLDYLR